MKKIGDLNFSTQLSLLFGSLLVFSFIVILVAINQVAAKSAQKAVEDEIHSATATVLELMRDRVQSIQQTVRLIAGDNRFQAAVETGDESMIGLQLGNHKNRYPDVDLAVLIGLGGVVVSNTYSDSLNGKQIPWPIVFDLVNKSESGEASSFVRLTDDFYYLSVVPLDMPGGMNWLANGFRVGKEMADKLSEITRADITFFYNSGIESELIASTIGPEASGSLISSIRNLSELSGHMFQYQTNGGTKIGHYLPLDYAENLEVSAFVGRPLEQELAPFRMLTQYIFWIFVISSFLCLGLIVRLSSHKTSSISQLSDAADAISRGDLDVRVPIANNDEIGRLSETFNQMVKGLSDKNKMQDLLGKVVSKEIAAKLIADGIELGGEEREVSILICDMHGFTSLSEKHSATETIKALNIFFTEVSNIVESYHGIVDKYIGDAVMAIFSAPLEDLEHAHNAMSCGIELSRNQDRLSALLPAEMGENCRYGIGIHSGKAVAGNVGSARRLNYTVIGDTVNVAFGIESQTRNLDIPIVTTSATVNRCREFEFFRIRDVHLKGRQQSIGLYTPVEFIQDV